MYLYVKFCAVLFNSRAIHESVTTKNEKKVISFFICCCSHVHVVIREQDFLSVLEQYNLI